MTGVRITREGLISAITRVRHPDVRNVALYGAATAVAALLTLIQTRVLWHALQPADFGRWSLIDPLLLPGASFLLFGVEVAVVKQVRVDRLPLRDVVGALMVTTLPATTLGLTVLGLISAFVFQLPWTGSLVLAVGAEALLLVMQASFRASNAVNGFAMILVARNLLYLLLLLAVSSYRSQATLPIDIVFLTRGACVILIGLAATFVVRPVPRMDWKRYGDAVHYAFPLLLTSFIYALNDVTDRWILAEFRGVIAAGIYAVQLKIAAILSQAIVVPFGLWFFPERFRHLEDADGGAAFFIRVAVVLAMICSYLSGMVWLARDALILLIAPGASASSLVLAFCLGGVCCLALSQALNVGLLLTGHTKKNINCNVYSTAVTVALASAMAPLLGVAGAAASRFLGGVVLVCVTAAWSRQVVAIDFPFRRLALYFGMSAMAAFIIDEALSGHGLPGTAVALILWNTIMITFASIGWIKLYRERTAACPTAPEI